MTSTNTGLAQNSIDLSNLRIKFSIKRTDSATPNSADIRVYNVSDTTALALLAALTPETDGILQNTIGQVILQAGYNNDFGVIFQGNIWQIILGRESATDTFVDIIAGDGANAYNFAIMNNTIDVSANQGTTQSDQVNAIASVTKPLGVDLGYVQNLAGSSLPRGKVMYGNANKYLRAVSQNTNQTWSIQNGKINFIPVNSYLPGTVVTLTSKTGLIGTPQQTNVGLNIKCLINPFIQVGTLVNINEASVAQFKIDPSAKGTANLPAPRTQDGIYYVMTIEHSGDTRGQEWYSSIVAILNDPTANVMNSVKGNYGL